MNELSRYYNQHVYINFNNLISNYPINERKGHSTFKYQPYRIIESVKPYLKKQYESEVLQKYFG
jgi:hypothetical protein